MIQRICTICGNPYYSYNNSKVQITCSLNCQRIKNENNIYYSSFFIDVANLFETRQFPIRPQLKRIQIKTIERAYRIKVNVLPINWRNEFDKEYQNDITNVEEEKITESEWNKRARESHERIQAKYGIKMPDRNIKTDPLTPIFVIKKY